MRILVLIDGLHARETLDALDRLVKLAEADLLLAYVRGAGPRSGLEMMRRRAGGRPIPPPLEREIAEAERAGSESAIAEAVTLARRHATSVESVQMTGEPGRAICELAARRKVDLVVVRAGGRDRPPLGPASLGPAARFITDHSPSPVLLLRNA